MILLIWVLFGSWALASTVFGMLGIPIELAAILGIVGPVLVVRWALKKQ